MCQKATGVEGGKSPHTRSHDNDNEEGNKTDKNKKDRARGKSGGIKDRSRKDKTDKGVINHDNRSGEGAKSDKNKKDRKSDKLSNHSKMSVDLEDMFHFPDFDEDDDPEDFDYQPPSRKQGRTGG